MIDCVHQMYDTQMLAASNAKKNSKKNDENKFNSSVELPPRIFNRFSDSEKSRRRVCFEEGRFISKIYLDSSSQEAVICSIVSGLMECPSRKPFQSTTTYFDLGCCQDIDDHS